MFKIKKVAEMLIFLLLLMINSSIFSKCELNKLMIDQDKNNILAKEKTYSSDVQTKKNKNKQTKNNNHNFKHKKEGARLIGSIAQIIDDPRDSDNVLSAILNIISIFFKYIQHVEKDHHAEHRSITSNAEMELLVTACFDLLNKLDLQEEEKYHIINEVRSKIVELNEQNLSCYFEDQVEFLQLC